MDIKILIITVVEPASLHVCCLMLSGFLGDCFPWSDEKSSSDDSTEM